MDMDGWMDTTSPFFFSIYGLDRTYVRLLCWRGVGWLPHPAPLVSFSFAPPVKKPANPAFFLGFGFRRV